jgi:hypothetical protein
MYELEMKNNFFCTFLSHKYEVAIERKIRDWTEGCCYMWTTSKHHCTYFSRTDELHWYIFSIIYIKKRPEENCFCAFQLYPCIIKAPKIYNKNTKNSKNEFGYLAIGMVLWKRWTDQEVWFFGSEIFFLFANKKNVPSRNDPAGYWFL